MNRWLLNSIGAALLAVLGLGTWGGFGLTKQAYIALQNLGNEAEELQRTTADVQRTVNTLSGPCKDVQGDYICPPLTQLSQTEKNIGILAGKSAQQTMQVGTLVTAVARNLNTVGDSVKQVASNLSGTAQAATGSLNAATALLQTADDPKKGLPDLLGRSDAVLTDFETWERSKALADMQADFAATLGNVRGITDSGNKMLVTGNAVEQKLSKCTLHPTFPCVFKSDVIFGAQVGGYLLR